MKNGKLANITIWFYFLMILYEMTYPSSKSCSDRTWEHVISYCFFYFLTYGISFYYAKFAFKKANFKYDSLAAYTLMWYSGGKFFYFMFLINHDFPTYISLLNSKFVSVVISLILWGFSIMIWVKRYKVDKLLKL